MVASYKTMVHTEQETQLLTVDDIEWNSEHKAITIGRMHIVFTPSEYRLLFPLRYGTPVTYAQLAFAAYNYSVDEKVRTMMDKHVDRMRGKMRGSGMYVYCILSYGYILLPVDEPNEALRLVPRTRS